MPLLDDAVVPLVFACPRCGTEVHERLYGPCESCRSHLGDHQRIAARTVEVAAYEPKMNVTPNFVATKE
jgi:hypothetical protein